MKKLVAFVMATMILAVLFVPAVMAAPSPERPGMVKVPTKTDIPAATADSPDFVYVEDEDVVYVKYDDPETGYVYLPEDQVPSEDKYSISGDSTWLVGSGSGYAISTNAPADKLVCVVVDGTVLKSTFYTVETGDDGNAKITIAPDYLSTLSVGKHSLALKFTDGVVRSEFTIKAAQQGGNNNHPQTGDDSNTSTWVAIGLIALGAVCMVSLTLVKNGKSAEKK